MKSKTKGLFTPVEILHDKRLNSNEKYLLSVYWYYTINGKQHCCSLTNSDIQDELGISKATLNRSKQHLLKLGLIRCNGGIKVWYKGSQNETLEGSQNETIESQNETIESQNETIKSQNETIKSQNETIESQNETHNKENKENKKNKEKNKENKKEKQEKEESFLDDWEKQVLLEKEEQKKNSLNNSTSNNSTINNSCTVVDMVMGLPTKDDVPIKDEPEIKTIDSNTLLDTIAKKMVDKISYSIKTQVNQIKHECDKQMFLKENEFNELQLTKHIKEYLKDRDLTKIIQDVNVFNRFAINAFNSYKNGIKKAVNKLPKKNPYSDLDDSNSSYNEYKETNRWER